MHCARRALPLKYSTLFKAVKKADYMTVVWGCIRSTRIYPKNLKKSDVPAFSGRLVENESVWLHMEYKYFLELLRRGLPKEFFTEIQGALVPFLDPVSYGRSILQNSSFIASSAHEDKNLHGQGFVARLSGSTARFCICGC